MRSRTVEDALRAIGQTMASVGTSDKRLTAPRQVEYRLKTLLAGYARDDPEPTRVLPVPISLINYGHSLAVSPFDCAVVDMAYMAFFFLNRPGEYARTVAPDPQTLPFRLCDVVFSIGSRRLPATSAPLADLEHATFVLLNFSQQKNGVRGEGVGHGRSGHPFACPVRALLRRVLHLRHFHAPPDTPLYTVYTNQHLAPSSVTAARITSMLRLSATALSAQLGLPCSRLSARSLRAGGAMALLCAKVDTDIIRLVGRWRSDEMLRYLHLQAYPLMHTFARQMHNHGSFTLLPGQTVPAAAIPLLDHVALPPPAHNNPP